MTNTIITTIQTILNQHTGYAIAKTIGVAPNQINRLQNGERKIENMSLELAIKILTHYADVHVKPLDQ